MKIINRFIGVLVLLIFLAGCQIDPADKETINVGGHAEMTVMPDLAKVYAGYSVVKPTAADAQAEADKVTNAIVDGLRYIGISENDIETENLILYEERVWVEADSQMKNVGWRATQNLKIKTGDLTKVGDIVDVAVKNGANQINSVEFYLSASKDDDSKQLVLAKATQNAKSKAQTMADSLGVKLDKIVSASESNYGYRPFEYNMMNKDGAAAVSESAKVLPRDVSVSADMTLVYSIKQV